MKNKIIGIGGIEVTSNVNEAIKTYALGSCVAIIIYDREKKISGMAHIALPESSKGSSINREKGYYADIAIPELIKIMKRKGSLCKGMSFSIKIAGGASMMDSSNVFNIGKRNVLAIKKELWKLGLAIKKQDVGENFSRTVSIINNTGQVIITCPGKENWEI